MPPVPILNAPSVVVYGVALHPHAHGIAHKHGIGMQDVLAKRVVDFDNTDCRADFAFRGAPYARAHDKQVYYYTLQNSLISTFTPTRNSNPLTYTPSA